MPELELERRIVKMVRDMSDDEILALVRGQLNAGKKLSREVPKKAKEPRRAPKRLRPKNKPAKRVTAPPKDLSDNEKAALKAIGKAKEPMSLTVASGKLKISRDSARTALDNLVKRGLAKCEGQGGGKKRPRRYLYSKV